MRDSSSLSVSDMDAYDALLKLFAEKEKFLCILEVGQTCDECSPECLTNDGGTLGGRNRSDDT